MRLGEGASERSWSRERDRAPVAAGGPHRRLRLRARPQAERDRSLSASCLGRRRRPRPSTTSARHRPGSARSRLDRRRLRPARMIVRRRHHRRSSTPRVSGSGRGRLGRPASDRARGRDRGRGRGPTSSLGIAAGHFDPLCRSHRVLDCGRDHGLAARQRRRQRSAVDHDELLGRTRERDIELAPAGLGAGHDVPRLDQDHSIELKALGIGAGQQRHALLELIRRDLARGKPCAASPPRTGDSWVWGRSRRRIGRPSSAPRRCRRRRPKLPLVDALEPSGRRGPRARARCRKIGRDRREDEVRQLHDAPRDAIADGQLVPADAALGGRCAEISSQSL